LLTVSAARPRRACAAQDSPSATSPCALGPFFFRRASELYCFRLE